ncbi:RHS repeat-associated core domain-containing protein [Myxococcus sp. AS-1-15]|uniref:RHS repeat-associated core domain-containing protein n=1 Tax=Myxococcus sp. AS-1-15 TaxID=2874600 RepID=UPI001CBD3DAB|nr:RHS repeat-associated core domain-containing protein [Myxococcus sp. AS-1-15]MBZ4396092.1 FG-GAP-like repeat-containing protein [Myxococcus sp. AS-1-15]BDT37597.1 RHS repeat-associated core domain-containing protein [Myxococcus sp. MH1]
MSPEKSHHHSSLRRFVAAHVMLFLYGTQLVSCAPSSPREQEEERSAQHAKALGASQNIPFELRQDTILATGPAGQSTPGAIPFSADVTASGSAAVSIPLWVPPGRAGIQPSLSIVYDSQGSDGILGPGFNLAGLSQITLCPNTIARDNKLHAIDLTNYANPSDSNRYTKTYCLDGMRLVRSGLREFKTERDSYASIRIPAGDSTADPNTFEVLGRDGLVRTYGKAAGNRKDALLRGQHFAYTPHDGAIQEHHDDVVTLAWALASIEDRFGNRMEVFYEQASPGTETGAWHRPSRIAYTQFKSASGGFEPGQREVTFDYETRPDTFLGYFSGVKVSRDFRLRRINMRGPGISPGSTSLSMTLLRYYELKYTEGAISKRSLLTQVGECDGGGICKKPLFFDWEQGSWEFTLAPPVNVSEAAAGAGLHAFGLGAGRQGLAYYVRSEKTREDDLDFHSTNGQVTDFTQQNWRDVMRLLEYPDATSTSPILAEETGFALWHPWFNIQGTGWLEDIWDSVFGSNDPGYFCGKRNERGLYPMVTDWNGMGRSSVTPLSCFWDVFVENPLSNPEGRLAPAYGHIPRGYGKAKIAGSEPNSQYWLDVDGDGRNERVWMGRHIIDLRGAGDSIVPNQRVVVVEPATGRTTKASPLGYFQPSRVGVRVADLDGTGKMNLLGVGPDTNTFLAALSYREHAPNNPDIASLEPALTTVRTPPEWNPFLNNPYSFTFDFIDVNGDGLRDAVTLGQMYFLDPAPERWVQHNSGNGFLESTKVVLPSDLSQMLLGAKTEHGDFDGDGRIDLAIFKKGEPVQLWLAGTRGDFARTEKLSSVLSGDNLEWAQVVDVNNDGLLDFTFRQGNQLRVAFRTRATDVLKSVNFNQNANYTFDYAPLSQANPTGVGVATEPFYSKSNITEQWWLRAVPETTRVVARLSLMMDGRRTRRWHYLYRDGLSDMRGLGWLGFGQRVVVDEVTGARTTTRYDNVSMVPGADQRSSSLQAHLPVEENVEIQVDLNTALQTQRTWTYARIQHAYALTYQQYARRFVEVVREVKGTLSTVVSETETIVELDAHGTPISHTVLTHGADKTEQVKTLTTPGTFDAATWLPAGDWTVATSWMSCARAISLGCSGQPESTNIHTQRMTYGALGEVASTETEPSLSGESVTPTTSEAHLKTFFTRNDRGLVVRVSQHGSGEVRTGSVTYDSLDQTQLASTTDAGGATWRYLFHPGLGVLAQTEDPNGVHTRVQYDGFGRERIATPLYQGPSSAPANKSIVRSFYEWQGSTPQLRVQADTNTGAAGVTEATTSFDALGRPVSHRAPRFDGQTVLSTIDYDDLGRVVKQEAPRLSTEMSSWEAFEYDPLGRVTARRVGDSTTGPRGMLVETRLYAATAPYISQAVSFDAAGQMKRTLVDFRGLMTRTTEAPGTALEATMAYTYGPFGRLEHVDDPAGNRSSHFYDASGRLERTVDPSAGTRLFLYNAFGELKSQSDAPSGTTGRLTTTYQRDLLGRVLSATNEKERLDYVYDSGPGAMRRLSRTTRTPVGDSDGVVIKDHVYDPFGRETDTALRVGGETLVMSREYDDFGRVKRLTYPVARNGVPMTLEYSFMNQGSLATIYSTSISSPFAIYWRAYARDSMGRLKTAHYGNGVARSFQYDSQGRLRFQEARHGGNKIQSLAYDYTYNDNLSARHDLMVGVTQKYTYDALDRLERWKVQQNCQTLDVQFQYDKLGNMLSRSPVTGTEPSASFQYTGGTSGGPHAVKQAQLGAESFTYEYDHRGNQLAMRDAQGALVRSVQYTPANLPESITSSSGTVRFDYDASGTRVRKYSDNGQDETVYVGGLYQRRKQGSTVTHIVSIPSPEGVVAEVSWQEGSTSESTRYFLNDPQGSPDTVTDASGAVLERIKYEPFGGKRQAANLAQASTTSHTGARRGFTGHEQDDELGLINMRGRIYDPRMMKFLSVDPVIAEPGSAQAYNAYSYVLNNPLRYTDPSGFTPYGGELVSSWGGGWTGAPQSHQSIITSALERHLSMPGPSLYLPSANSKVPSVQALDDAKAQPDAHHTNDIGQSSGPSARGQVSPLASFSKEDERTHKSTLTSIMAGYDVPAALKPIGTIFAAKLILTWATGIGPVNTNYEDGSLPARLMRDTADYRTARERYEKASILSGKYEDAILRISNPDEMHYPFWIGTHGASFKPHPDQKSMTVTLFNTTSLTSARRNNMDTGAANTTPSWERWPILDAKNPILRIFLYTLAVRARIEFPNWGLPFGNTYQTFTWREPLPGIPPKDQNMPESEP